MHLVFLLFIALATGISAAYAGRDEVRLSPEPIWRMETFVAYGIFMALVMVPTAIYFYVFHGDWFLLYLVDTRAAPWLWGLFAVFAVLAVGAVGFRVGAALCRVNRDASARLATIGALMAALSTWFLAWHRLSSVGSYRQFTRDYGLTPFLQSPACYSGLAILLIGVVAFIWVMMRIGQQTHQPA